MCLGKAEFLEWLTGWVKTAFELTRGSWGCVNSSELTSLSNLASLVANIAKDSSG
jgi:hypothetical protein